MHVEFNIPPIVMNIFWALIMCAVTTAVSAVLSMIICSNISSSTGYTPHLQNTVSTIDRA